MGTGKTSVGHALAALLRFRFIDTDELIEARAAKRISAIFADDGEPKFREFERIVVEELVRHQKTVISTGGGLVANPANMTSLKSHALIVCLWASPEAIFERVRHQGHRPLLKTSDPLERIRALLAERARFYREADVLLNTEMRSAKEIALHIVHHFRLARASFNSVESSHPAKGL